MHSKLKISVLLSALFGCTEEFALWNGIKQIFQIHREGLKSQTLTLRMKRILQNDQSSLQPLPWLSSDKLSPKAPRNRPSCQPIQVSGPSPLGSLPAAASSSWNWLVCHAVEVSPHHPGDACHNPLEELSWQPPSLVPGTQHRAALLNIKLVRFTEPL